MFEICKDVALPCQSRDSRIYLTASFCGVTVFPQPQVREIRRDNVRSFQLLAFGMTQRHISPAQDLVDLVAEPRRVPKLKRGPYSTRQTLQKFLERSEERRVGKE